MRKNKLLYTSGVIQTIISILALIVASVLLVIQVLELLGEFDVMDISFLTNLLESVPEISTYVIGSYAAYIVFPITTAIVYLIPDLAQFFVDYASFIAGGFALITFVMCIILCVLAKKRRKFSTFQPETLKEHKGARFSIIFFPLLVVIFLGGSAGLLYYLTGELLIPTVAIAGYHLLFIILDIIGLSVGAKVITSGSKKAGVNNNLSEEQFFGTPGTTSTGYSRQVSLASRETNIYNPQQPAGPQPFGQPTGPQPYGQTARPAAPYPTQAPTFGQPAGPQPYGQPARPAAPYPTQAPAYGQPPMNQPYGQPIRPQAPAPVSAQDKQNMQPLNPQPANVPIGQTVVGPAPTTASAVKTEQPSLNKQDNSALLTAKLKELSALKASGSISEEEYKNLKQKAFQKFLNN